MGRRRSKKRLSENRLSVSVISEDEWMFRTLKYMQRLQDLHTSSNLVKGIKKTSLFT